MTQDEFDSFVNELKDFSVFWLTMFGESRGEPIEGIIGVGNVIKNRVKETGKSYHEVCLKGVDLYHHQFSCWNLNDPNLDMILQYRNNSIDPICREIRYIAEGLIDNFLNDNTHGANHYITTKLFRNNPPSWARNGYKIQLGNQTFIECA